MDDMVFLYDQVIETVARLRTFASVRVDEIEGHPDIKDDADSAIEQLARRDLLMLAASMRNFSETVKETKLVRSSTVITSDIAYDGPPFFRDTLTTITLYQCLSRVLHSHDLRIFRRGSDYIAAISRTPDEYMSRISAFRREDDGLRYLEPVIYMSTEQEGLTAVRLQSLLTSVCSVLGQISDKLGERKIFLQRDYR